MSGDAAGSSIPPYHVTFTNVTKPSAAAGFFSVRAFVKESFTSNPFGGGGFIETALPETATAYGPVLCEPDKPVTFEAVEKPSETAGFFSIGARAAREW